MKKLSCILGNHDYTLDTTFTVPVTDESCEHVYFHAPVAYGLVCAECQKRKLRYDSNPWARLATGIMADAKIWLQTGAIVTHKPKKEQPLDGACEHLEMPAPPFSPKLVVNNDG